MSSDRHIHARTADGTLIVRYNRAGKWYAERPANGGLPAVRRSLTFAQAVEMAAQEGSYVYLGQSGGGRFDAEMRKLAKARP